VKRKVHQQKYQDREEILQQIMGAADCIRGNDKIIEKAINSL